MILGEISSEDGVISFDARLEDIEKAADIAAASARMGQTAEEKQEITIVSYNLSEMTLSSPAEDKATAVKDCIRYLVQNEILSDDIAQTWQPELAKGVFSHPSRYIIRTDPRSDAYYRWRRRCAGNALL
jgi:hypothetical protein